MGASIPHRSVWLVGVFVCALSGVRADQGTAVRDAAAALERGDFAAAERTLRAEAVAHPDDAWTLSLLGYSLDNQKRGQEAEEFHRRAVALSPRSAEILNNYGTHLWILEQYGKAETVFTDALAAAPTYFNVLYNLGVMATYAGHYDRAREVLQSALEQQPKNVDVLYRLATAEELSKRWEQAATRLAQAAQLDPKRADVQKLLAFTAAEMGALADAAAAWDRYLALQPNDDAARRERGYTAVKMGKLEQGIADIEWFLARHPDDKAGHFELGQAERSLDVAKALQHFDRALALDPNFGAARVARGGLCYQNGNFEAALKDLEAASALDPDDAATLDRLGQTYQALDRTADAVRVLRRAAERAPDDSKILLHFSRALADSGQTEESKVVMDQFRQLGPEKKVVVPEGLVSYLSLTPEQRRSDYRARVEKVVREHSGDAAAQVDYLKLLLEERDAKSVTAVARHIAALKPASNVLADAGRALLDANQFALARDLFQQAVASGPTSPAVQLDAAVATFQAGPPAVTAKAGLELLDRIPESQRGGDYELAHAQMLEASGKPQEAAAALDRAVNSSPERPDLCMRAAAFLVSKGRAAEALRLIDNTAGRLPDNREILLMKATTLEFAKRTEDADGLLERIERRWPEWSAAWAAHGIILAAHQHYPQAVPVLEAAVALGARNPETYFFLARAYEAVGRRLEAQSARERVQTSEKSDRESFYLNHVFEGSLLFQKKERVW
jgi:tetratricopeptide (TPR) repeat protein